MTDKVLGKGAFGVCMLGRNKNTGESYAIKIIPNEQLNNESLRNEIGILHACHHDNIIKLETYWQDDKFVYIVMEYAEGGDLFDHIIKRKYYTEINARNLIKQLLSALFYLASNNVAHLDIKNENILLKYVPSDYDINRSSFIPIIKLSDFGTSVLFNKETLLKHVGGSPGYCAPEVILHKMDLIGPKSDIYSLGVVAYILISGQHPFQASQIDEIFKRQINNQWHFSSKFDRVSDTCKDFILKCLTYDPQKRPSAKQLLMHRFMQESNLKLNDLSNNKEELKRIIVRIKARSGVQAMLVVEQLKSMIKQIQQ